MAMTLRTDEELDAALTALAEAEGVSRQEVVRRAVLEKLERSVRRSELDRVLDEELPRYGEALRRLGE